MLLRLNMNTATVAERGQWEHSVVDDGNVNMKTRTKGLSSGQASDRPIVLFN